MQRAKLALMTEYKEIIVALIAVFGTALGVVFPYVYQKNKELNLRIAEQKREAYASFLTNFTEVAVAVMHNEEVSGKDADRDRMLARDKLLLYASDDVIKAYDAWVRYPDGKKHDYDKEGELVSSHLSRYPQRPIGEDQSNNGTPRKSKPL